MENRIKDIFTKAGTLDESGTTPYPRDANLKNNSRRKGERGHTCKNNIKAKPEQLKLNKTYPSMWP
jgi:hypothetical protein